MNNLKKSFMDATVRSKMIFSHIFIALIPFCMVGILGITISTGEAQKNVTQYTRQMVGQVQQTIDVYISSIEKLANMLIMNMEDMQLGEIYPGDEIRWNECQAALERDFKVLAKTHDEISGIFLATQNDLYVSTGMTRISRDPFDREDWYQRACDSPDEIVIISRVIGRNIETNAADSIDNVFSLVKAVTDPKTGEVVGVLLFDIKHDIISNAIQETSIGDVGFVFVLDDNGQMVYAPFNDIVYRVSPAWMSDKQNAVTAEIKGEKYQIRHQQSDYTGWNIVSVFSYREIMSSVTTMSAMFVSVLVIVLVVVMMVAMKLSETITKPIVELRNLMKKTERGDLEVRFEGTYKDEVSELGRRFNHMLSRIRELLQEVYQEQENKRKAELKVVQEQFKPHFLYNTLDTIGWMAREHSAADIVQVVDALTNVFRLGLSRGKDFITIAEEVQYLSNYLYIQKIRYGPKVLYEIELADDCRQVVIPKLILQPLVENAIYHGVKLKRGEGHLRISVSKGAAGWVAMTIEDDGKGMAADKVKELADVLNNWTRPQENESFGLFYVKERLAMRYQNCFQVLLASTEGEGTRITIVIPEEYAHESREERDEE